MRATLKNVKIGILISLAFSLLFAACQTPVPAEMPVTQPDPGLEASPSPVAPVEDTLPTAQSDAAGEVDSSDAETIEATATSLPTATEATREDEPVAGDDAVGAAEAQASLNPLTHQPCQDPSLLNLPPALVSVSNFPVTARPQAGLSYAPYVFELFIGEGMTRFLALFYCDFPGEAVSGDNTIGPIRSGRLPYESLRKLYNGFLIMASASGEVSTKLADASNIYGAEEGNINSALVSVSKLKGIAESQAGQGAPNLSGNQFDPEPPQAGFPADRLWVFYNYLNQVMWTYDSALGAYLRAQDNADGSGAFTPSTDRLNGEALAFENVVVLFVEHEVLNSEGTLIDVNLLYTLGRAYLFRDGQMVPIRWSTENGAYEKETGKLRPIRFVDQEGNPVALKPGRVWVEFVHLTTTIGETEPGSWKVRFYAP